jgi:K(+)-stimulated pyrophosphate-energized sodium pump
VWIFIMRVLMVISERRVVLHQRGHRKGQVQRGAAHMNFEAAAHRAGVADPLVSVGVTYAASYALVGGSRRREPLVEASTVITCGTLAGAIIPEFVKVFTSTSSAHVREVVTASREGGASLNVLSGFVAGNFSAYWLGMVIVLLMGVASRSARWAWGPHGRARRLRVRSRRHSASSGMGPVTIAVDSYGPVTDNAQSVYELSVDRDDSERGPARSAATTAST